MRMRAAHPWIFGCVLLIARPSAASRDTECTDWRLDAPTPLADGGTESTQCTCLEWNEYGDPPPLRFACDLCALVPGEGGQGTCLSRGATLPPPEGCSHGGGVSLVATAVALLWLARRGGCRERLLSMSNGLCADRAVSARAWRTRMCKHLNPRVNRGV
jgi:hypothetical protein